MSPFGEALSDLAEVGPGITQRFAAAIDAGWIEEALAATDSASIRRRKLPAEQAVWLVLGMGLFADRSIAEVVDHLGLVLPGTKSLARSAIPQARYRLGPEPLEWLFQQAATSWQSRLPDERYRGLALYAVDGSCVRVQDTDENFEHFGKPDGRNGANDSGYPMLRIACLMALASRLIVDACFAKYRTSEQDLTAKFWARIPGKSLTLLDRGFNDYRLLASLVDEAMGRHVLVRLREDIKPEFINELPDGSSLVRLVPHRLLKRQHPELRSEIPGRVISYKHTNGKPCRIFTTLVDAERFPQDELIDLYHDRWEIELGYDELKTHMLERNECLRSKKPGGVEQEVWGLLLTYNLVRFEMAETAAQRGLPPHRMSFRHSLVWMRTLWEVTAWRSSPGTIPKKLAELRSRIELLVNPERRAERRYERHVKIKMSGYKRNRGKRIVPRSSTSTPP